MRNYICKIEDQGVSLRIRPGEMFEKVEFVAMELEDPAHYIVCSMDRIYFEILLDEIRTGYLLALQKQNAGEFNEAELWSSPLEEFISKKVKKTKQVILDSSPDSSYTLSLVVRKAKTKELDDKLTLTIAGYPFLRGVMLESEGYLKVWNEVYGKTQILEDLYEMKCLPEKSLSSNPVISKVSQDQQVEESVSETIFKACGKFSPLENGYYSLMAYTKEGKSPVCIHFSQERIRMEREFWNEFSKKVHRGISFTIGYIDRESFLEFDHFVK